MSVLPEENTLGFVPRARSRPFGRRPPETPARQRANARGRSIGTGYLGVGGGVMCAIAAVFGLASFSSHITVYPNAGPVLLAWLLFIVAFASFCLTLAARGDRLQAWVVSLYLFALCGVVVLDIIAIWPLHDVGTFASASIAAGFGLLPVITLRRTGEMLLAVVILAATFSAVVLLTTPLTASSAPSQIIAISLATLPALWCISIVRRFRRIVAMQLDLVLVGSTVIAPRHAVGMLASEELARLDLAAEKLLDAVADGSLAIPLDAPVASQAAAIATELRLHLIEGRRSTWLHHAITESDNLGKSTTVSDPGSLAGLLSAEQRDGLLSALWLLSSDEARRQARYAAVRVQVQLGPVLAPQANTPRRCVAFPITISITGIRPNKVDQAVWESLAKVGEFIDSFDRPTLRFDIHCIAANPADN